MKPSLRLAFGLVAAALVMTHFLGQAHAQSSLGIGVNDGMAPTTGPFAHILMWINLRQQEFYRALAAAMKEMREDGSKMWLLIGLSFAYGIFHAAGPGHGKAVISSYLVANNETWRRGVILSLSAYVDSSSTTSSCLISRRRHIAKHKPVVLPATIRGGCPRYSLPVSMLAAIIAAAMSFSLLPGSIEAIALSRPASAAPRRGAAPRHGRRFVGPSAWPSRGSPTARAGTRG